LSLKGLNMLVHYEYKGEFDGHKRYNLAWDLS
jgi:predicted secreted protein